MSGRSDRTCARTCWPRCRARSAACPTAWRPRSWPASTRSRACTRASRDRSPAGSTSNTRLMVITTTSAAALAAGSALQGVPADDRPAAVPLLVIMVGIVLVAAGLVRLGRYTRFVSYSVMIGFLTGIAVNIVCGQIAGPDRRPGAWLVPAGQGGQHPHPSRQHRLGVLAHRAGRARDPGRARPGPGWPPFSTLIALVIPTVVVVLAGADSVARVGDVGGIPGGHPDPAAARRSISCPSA